MDTKFFYSSSENSFYPADLLENYEAAGTLPDDLIGVDEGIFFEIYSDATGRENTYLRREWTTRMGGCSSSNERRANGYCRRQEIKLKGSSGL